MKLQLDDFKKNLRFLVGCYHERQKGGVPSWHPTARGRSPSPPHRRCVSSALENAVSEEFPDQCDLSVIGHSLVCTSRLAYCLRKSCDSDVAIE